ncbi:MAG: hypothetical protein JKY99_12775 [Rhizobiales bacterium]|nr:hypothetical protein [Hyphomicrobiales bacterium]
MKKEISDYELAEDMVAQLKIITDGYEIGTRCAIDDTLNYVTGVQRMKSNGILDMIASYPEDDDSD